MSATHIQPLPNVRGRMSYTELGEGKKRTRNIREKTNRIAAQMGDHGHPRGLHPVLLRHAQAEPGDEVERGLRAARLVVPRGAFP